MTRSRRRTPGNPADALVTLPTITTSPSETDWFYPQRKRCLKCRRFFGFIVIKRLYDSYECAGMEPPKLDPRERPRECRTRVGEAKAAYNAPEDVQRTPSGARGFNDKDTTVHVYECGHCGMYHIGHRP